VGRPSEAPERLKNLLTTADGNFVKTEIRVAQTLAEANDAANKARHRSEQMATLSPGSVYIPDFKHRVPIYANRNTAHSLGHTEEQVQAAGERFRDKHSGHRTGFHYSC
jgi:sortase (surface protein transpeptidase)